MTRKSFFAFSLLFFAPVNLWADTYPLEVGNEWVYLVFDDTGQREVAFKAKRIIRVKAKKELPGGGFFYWVRRETAELKESRASAAPGELLDLSFEEPKAEGDDVIFKDESFVYLIPHKGTYQGHRRRRALDSIKEFEKICGRSSASLRTSERASGASTVPSRWLGAGDSGSLGSAPRAGQIPMIPVSPEVGQRWGLKTVESTVIKKEKWISDVLGKDWGECYSVMQKGSGEESEFIIWAEGVGMVGRFSKTRAGQTYTELALHHLSKGGPAGGGVEMPGAKIAVPHLPPGSPGMRRGLANDPASILVEMRLREILGPEEEVWQNEDFSFLLEMRREEERGAVDFLKESMGYLLPYVRELDDRQGNIRLLLTKKGFEIYKFHLTQAAIKELESRGVTLKYMFYLEDEDSRPLFGAEGRLSPAGERLYWKLRRGKAARWKLPGQELPPLKPSKDKKEGSLSGTSTSENPKIKVLLQAGLKEVYSDEVTWVEKAVDCTERQLVRQHGLEIVPEKGGRQPRYFFPKKAIPYSVILIYRSGDKDFNLTSGTGFFGIGGGKRSLCQ